MVTFLPSRLLPDFLEILRRFGELHGPVINGSEVLSFGPVDSPADMRLDYRRTLIPPKKYVLYPEEALLLFSPEKGYETPESSDRKISLFGLHPCDLAGICYLDRVFISEFPDPSYEKKRRNLTLIGHSCEPDAHCSCADMGIIRPTGFDLFFEQIEDGYRILCGTERGRDILSRGRDIFCDRKNTSGVKRKRILPLNPLRTNVDDTLPASPLWAEFADRCLSCGACSACCPTCYCFDVMERGTPEGKGATRFRSWDNCLFKAHGEIAGGTNFRPTRLERLQYRFLHKFRGFGPLSGIPSCVGCGRCSECCPVNIDLLDLFPEEAGGKVQ